MEGLDEYETINIDQLPLELQYHILAQLPFEDIVSIY